MAAILLIEDDMVSAMVLRLFLEEAGHTVQHADNTDDALTMSENGKPDFVLSDWAVGGTLSPAQVARKLREKYPAAKLAFITGYPREDVVASVSDLQPFTVYSKPIDPENIISALPNLP